MALNPTWRIELVNADDMSLIDQLPYSFSFTPTLNRPGSFSMSLPLDERIAYEVRKHATGVLCTRNDGAKWSGEVVSTNKNAGNMTLGFTAIGWLDQLNHRFVRPSEEASLVFTGAVGGSIAQTLVTVANAQTDDDTGTARPTAVGFGAYADTQVRTRSYKRGQSYGQALQELSDVENGFDLYVDPVSRKLYTVPPDAYVDRTELVFGYAVDPTNLSDLTEADDGSSTAQRVTVVDGSGVSVSADDAAAIVAQGGFMREEWLSVSNVSDALIVGAYANAEMVYRRYGHQSYDLKVQPYDDVPRLYDDFELGDQVYLSADAGALQLERQPIRIFSVTLEVDDQGNESITQIVTAPQ